MKGHLSEGHEISFIDFGNQGISRSSPIRNSLERPRYLKLKKKILLGLLQSKHIFFTDFFFLYYQDILLSYYTCTFKAKGQNLFIELSLDCNFLNEKLREFQIYFDLFED